MKIGIGGVSRAGKTKLANFIKDLFPGLKLIILCQDDFVFDQDKLPMVKDEIDWEVPASIDFRKFLDAINMAAKDHEIVIAEGLLVFYNSQLCKEFDRKIFVHIEEDIFRKRKLKDTRWGSFPGWYVDHIWESFMKYGMIENGRRDFLYLDGNLDFNRDKILDYLSLNVES